MRGQEQIDIGVSAMASGPGAYTAQVGHLMLEQNKMPY